MKISPGHKRAKAEQNFLLGLALDCGFYNFRKATRVMTRVMNDELEPAGITAPQYSLLLAVAMFEPATIRRLSRDLEMDRTALSRNLKLLENARLVRALDTSDLRTRRLELTDKGRAKLEEIIVLRNRVQEKIEGALGSAGWRKMRRDLHRLMSKLEES